MEYEWRSLNSGLFVGVFRSSACSAVCVVHVVSSGGRPLLVFLIADNLESSLKIHISEDLTAGFKSARFVNLNVY